MLTIYSAYEHGYRAAATARPRKVPASVRKILPSVSPEWFRGYDQARTDSEANRAQTLAGFKT